MEESKSTVDLEEEWTTANGHWWVEHSADCPLALTPARVSQVTFKGPWLSLSGAVTVPISVLLPRSAIKLESHLERAVSSPLFGPVISNW